MHINIESKEQFEELRNKGVVLIDFWAPWCGPCRMLAPYLEEIAEVRPNINIVKVNVDEFGDIANEFQVSAIPSLFLLINGEISATNVGFMPKPALEDMIDKNI